MPAHDRRMLPLRHSCFGKRDCKGKGFDGKPKQTATGGPIQNPILNAVSDGRCDAVGGGWKNLKVSKCERVVLLLGKCFALVRKSK